MDRSSLLELFRLSPRDPVGIYLVEDDGDRRLLLRVSEGEPPDGALDAAPSWWLRERGQPSNVTDQDTLLASEAQDLGNAGQ